ncbi:MAG: hypothetical protein RL235_538, partial [Chlamydiota bacterium]
SAPTTYRADLTVEERADKWALYIDEPSVDWNHEYIAIASYNEEETKTLRQWRTSAHWLLRTLKRRKQILYKVGLYLLKAQPALWTGKGTIAPLTIRALADKLGLHESTLSRAIAGKVMRTPRGLIPLSTFVPGNSPKDPLHTALQQLIAQENPSHPLTDDELKQALQQRGFQMARRTIAKHRQQLQIAPSYRRVNKPNSPSSHVPECSQEPPRDSTKPA